MNKDNRLIFEAFINKTGSEEEINVQKADLNKDKKLSDYEVARAKAINKAQGDSGKAPSEDAQNPAPEIGIQHALERILDEVVNLIDAIKPLKSVKLQKNTLENISDLQRGLKHIEGELMHKSYAEDAEGPVKISHVSADEIKNKPQSGPVKIDWNSEQAEGKSSKLHPNTIKAQQLLDQAVQLIIKATNLPNVQWRYYDENNPDVDLQNALENIKDYVKQHIGF